MTLKDVHSVEIIGGGVRVPSIQKKVKSVLGGMDLGMHLNGDESPAQGAAFHAANISSQFKVRKVGMNDITPFAVNLEVQGLGESKEEESKWGFFGSGSGTKKKNVMEDEEPAEEMTGKFFKTKKVFDRHSLIGESKIIPFTYDQNVACRIVYENPEELPEGSIPIIASYNITGIDDFAKECEEKGLGKPQVQLTFKLDDYGMVVLQKAEALFKEEIPPEPEPEPEAESEIEDGETSDSEKEETFSDNEKEKSATDGETKADDEDIDISEETSNAKKEKSKKEKKSKKDAKKKKTKKPTSKVTRKTLKVDYDFSELKVKPYSALDIKTSVDRLRILKEKDEARKKLADVRNTLESLAYDSKNKFYEMEDEINAVSTEEQRSEVLTLADEYDDWLYDDGRDASYDEVFERVQKIKGLADAIYSRVKEKKNRKTAVKEAKKMLDDALLKIAKWNTTHPQITTEEKEGATKLVTDIDSWLSESVEKQASHPTHEKPVFLISDIFTQMKPLKNKLKALDRKPKPKPPPVEIPKKKKNTNSTSTTEDEDSESAINDGEEKLEEKREKAEETEIQEDTETEETEAEETETETETEMETTTEEETETDDGDETDLTDEM